MPWIDLHSHILPGFDDGADSEEEFLEMARVAVAGNTAVMATTPHYDLESLAFEPREVAEAVEYHNGLLRSQGLDLVLIPGLEVRINAGLYRLASDEGDLKELRLGENGRYMLMDLPLMDLPIALQDILFRVQLTGVTPILAHPERNRQLVDDPSMLRGLVDRGLKVQVNSGSLGGLYGKSAQRMARSLLKEGIAGLVASDAHSPRVRNPDLSGAAKALQRLLGGEAARLLLEVNPGRVLAGEDLEKTGGDRARGSLAARIIPWKK